MNGRCIIATALAAGFACFGAQADEWPPERLHLEDCLARGLERSLVLRNANRDVDIARMEIRAVRAQVYPSLEAQGQYTRVDDVPSIPEFPVSMGNRNNYQATATAEQLLYAGGSVKAALKIAIDYEDLASHERNRVASDLVRQITQGFYDVLYYQSAAEVARVSIRQRESFEAQVRARYQQETTSEFEWLSAQVALANERPALIAAENALTLTRRRFRDLILLDHDTFELVGDLATEIHEPALDELQDHAEAQRAELLQARSQYQAAVHHLSVTRAEYLPEIHAFASYGGADPSPRNPFAEGWEWEWSAGVRVNWSLFDGGRRQATLRADALTIEKIQAAIEDLQRATRLDVEQLWLLLQEARETLAGTAEAVTLAERAQTIATVRHKQGLVTHLEFTDSHLAFNRAQLQHHLAWRDLQHTWAELQHVAGLYQTAERE